MEMNTRDNQQDIESLTSEGIHLWGAAQEELENHALNELKIFVDETSTKTENNNITVINTESENPFLNTRINHSEDDESLSEYFPSEDEEEKMEKPAKKRRICHQKNTNRIIDDALEENYKKRLNIYYKKLENELETLLLGNSSQHCRADTIKDYKKLKGGLKVPKEIWNKLYEYQKDGIYWLWELNRIKSGGILGDEMGLGKTVQIIAFLSALEFSKIKGTFVGLGPSLIICPATVITQWLEHFHEWAPEFRIGILHQTGSYHGEKSKLIKEFVKNHGILLITYTGILKFKPLLCEHNWHYLILDEGHKIRNPTAKITIAVKEIRSLHRIILTGSPMQNNLTELWSLFDFTNSEMLGTLVAFTEHFTQPILQGGFKNSSSIQEATALSVATTLKNLIYPFLLRRLKKDVLKLPQKSEQVLFCSLSEEQRELYKDYLMSDRVHNILNRKGAKMSNNFLVAITELRKICNHPDLFINNEEESDINYKKSGKMIVVAALLKIWTKQLHRTLLFFQGRGIIKIFESFLSSNGYKYLKMDGTTSVGQRQSLIDQFNTDNSYQVFLLTTRVGGLGVNLTGADRVIIFDPDWNPATDTQAKERAWRIGQKKSVTIYRLLSAGTVEEKMYQRQIWKQLLSNKILIDPATNKFFKSSDLYDLFSLPEASDIVPETTNIFRESRVKIQKNIKINNEKKEKPNYPGFSVEKIREMKELAQKIAKSLTTTNKTKRKDAYCEELADERNKKLMEKEHLKKLTPQQLIEFNKTKFLFNNNNNNGNNASEINKIDDEHYSGITFDQALEKSEKNSILYKKITTKKIKSSEIKRLKRKLEDDSVKKDSGKFIDISKKIDGEFVQGLVKRETKLGEDNESSASVKNNEENCILQHLFNRKGVSGALEHDSVVNIGRKEHSLKDRSYAEEKALKSLEALKKSRIKNWKW